MAVGEFNKGLKVISEPMAALRIGLSVFRAGSPVFSIEFVVLMVGVIVVKSMFRAMGIVKLPMVGTVS